VDQRHDSQLLKGVLGLVLLLLLDERESYGYELVTRIHEAGLPDVPDGSVYPALRRLERDGHVTSRLVSSPAGPGRKYYLPTDAGKAFMAAQMGAWRTLVAAVDPLIPSARPVKRKEAIA
jgi:PadR family transcriptional regulator PadR